MVVRVNVDPRRRGLLPLWEKGPLRVRDDLLGMCGKPLQRSRGAPERLHSPGGVSRAVDEPVLERVVSVVAIGAERVQILRDPMLVVAESVVVSGAKLCEENLVLSSLDELVGGLAAFRVDLLRPFVIGFRVDNRDSDGGLSG